MGHKPRRPSRRRGDDARARELAELTRVGYGGIDSDPSADDLVDEIEAWIATELDPTG